MNSDAREGTRIQELVYLLDFASSIPAPLLIFDINSDTKVA